MTVGYNVNINDAMCNCVFVAALMIENGVKNVGWNFYKKGAVLIKGVSRWLNTVNFDQWVITWNQNIDSIGYILHIY